MTNILLAGSKEQFGSEIKELSFSCEYNFFFTVKSQPTEVDLKSNKIICNVLEEFFPNIPIMSKKHKQIPYEERKNPEYYWRIDPIDDTKKFIKKNDEFTINIALMHKDASVLGIVYDPAMNKMQSTKHGEGAYLNRQKLPSKTNNNPNEKLYIVTSRLHLSQKTKEFIDALEVKDIGQVLKKRSLKLFMVPSGEAEIYSSLAPTMESNTSAVDVNVREAKKMTYQFENDQPVMCDKENLLNPWFVVR